MTERTYTVSLRLPPTVKLRRSRSKRRNRAWCSLPTGKHHVVRAASLQSLVAKAMESGLQAGSLHYGA